MLEISIHKNPLGSMFVADQVMISCTGGEETQTTKCGKLAFQSFPFSSRDTEITNFPAY